MSCQEKTKLFKWDISNTKVRDAGLVETWKYGQHKTKGKNLIQLQAIIKKR